MRFAPGTPPSIIKKAEKEWLNSQKPSAGQRRYDNLASRPNLNPAQQRTMDRLGTKLGINQQTASTTQSPNNPGDRVRNVPISDPYMPRLSSTPNPADIGKTWDYGAPAGGNTGSIASGYNTGAPATTSYQGGTTGGMGGGMPGATGMPNTSTLPTGAAFKKGGMASKSSSALRRGDGIAQRGKTKGRFI
jgi:hypothetical protein